MVRKLVLMIAVATLALSEAAAAEKIVYGAGFVTCGEWQHYRTTGDKPASYQAQAWVDGYLSGLNSAGNGADFLAPKPSSITFYIWIDNYCAQNPLNELVQAVMALQFELSSRAQ